MVCGSDIVHSTRFTFRQTKKRKYISGSLASILDESYRKMPTLDLGQHKYCMASRDVFIWSEYFLTRTKPDGISFCGSFNTNFYGNVLFGYSLQKMKTTEPNQAPETRYMLVMPAASHPSRQARICLI